MELSQATKELCQNQALSQVLSEWNTDLDYDTIIDKLEDPMFDADESEDLMIWGTYEGNDGEWVSEQIQSLYQSFVEVAEFVLGGQK